MLSGLKSAQSKIVRAEKHLRAIKRRISLYARTHPHKIVPQSKSKKRKLTIRGRPPREISLLIGEMLYQMRSALDHLAFAVVQLNTDVAAIDADWREHCQFPLRLKLPKNRTAPLSKEDFTRDLPGIADAPFAFIERIQPYYGLGAVNNLLGILGQLSNIDKHRHLNLTRTRVRKFDTVRFPSGMRGSSQMVYDHGAEIDPPFAGYYEIPVYMKRRYRPFVAFDEREHLEDATTLPVDYLLKLILEQIKTVVIPAFKEMLKES